MTVVFSRCLCSLRPPFPSLLLAFFHSFWAFSLTHSLPSLHLMYYWRTQQAEGKRKKRKGKEGERKFMWHGQHTGLSPLKGALGGNEQCSDGECVQGVCSPFFPRYAKAYSYYLFWESYICKSILTCPTNTLPLSHSLPPSLITNTRSC